MTRPCASCIRLARPPSASLPTTLLAALTAIFIAPFIAVAGCDHSERAAAIDGSVPPRPDLVLTFADTGPDLAMLPELNPCMDENPTCAAATLGKPFGLQEDTPPSAGIHDQPVDFQYVKFH